jgi:predicted nucleic acid-binding protein
VHKLIVADTDFLSSFAKINELNLIFKVFKTKEIVITQAVYNELKESAVFDLLLPYFSYKNNKITINKISAKDVAEYLGIGERESITLAKENKAKLLMDDRVAGKYAEKIGVKIIDIPTFLFYCKQKKFLNNSQLKTIILKLKAKDFYEFEKEVEKELISLRNKY